MRRLIFALVLLTIRTATAGDSYYAYTYAPDVYYKTIIEGCQDLAHASINASWTIVAFHSMVNNGKQCGYTATNNSTGNTNGPVGGQTPVKMGECTADDPASVTWPLGVKDPETDEVPQSAAHIPPWPVCVEGCMAEKVSSAPFTSSCFTLEDNPLKVYCDFNGTYTGASCSSSEEPTPPELPECPSGYTDGPTGCVKDTPPDPCATDPQAEGCNGGGDTGGGDNGGDTGGGDTGGGDNGGGDTGGGDTGGGDTGGGDTGGGDTGGGDTDNGAASGTDCGTALSCTGDAVGCAIARIQKDFSCAMQDNNDFPAQKDDLKQLINDPQFNPVEDDEINVADLFDRGTRFLPSACPPPESLSLITNGGRSFEISYQPLCQLASDLGYLIVVAASIFYALYVGRSVGGE